ncbi:C39 family peptidase [Enterococcus sp. LJL120]
MSKRRNPRRKNKSAQLLLAGLLLLLGFTWFLTKAPFENLTIFQASISQTAFAKEANQKLQAENEQQVAPLILQTDEQWAQTEYGFSDDPLSENTLATNGCGIASLAMVLSYWQNQEISPLEILNWAQNNYYVADAGTSWQIFADFAAAYQLQYVDLGDDIYAAQTYLEQGIPVVASVTAGEFTQGGHILVLRDWQTEGIAVNDPNDDPSKDHLEKRYSAEEIAGQAIHYWTFTR